MNLEIIRTQTTWNDAAGSINNNYAKIADAIAQLKANGGGGGGGADIDLTDYATKVWVEAKGYITASALTPYLKTDDAEDTYATIASVSTLQTTLEAAITKKADSATTLSGYGITDAYTKIDVDKLLEDNATKTWVTANYATLMSIQGFENRIGGLEGAVPQLNDRVTTVESKVSTLNETVSTGKNNLLGRVNVIEEEYATKTYVDNAIDGIDLSPYLKTDDAEETYATKDFVNNKLVNYATIVSVTAIKNTLTGQIGAVGASVEQLAATKLDSSYFTLANIKSTLGISDWALAATKPSYAWSEITSRPTALSQFTDDVVAGKYLPLSGGELNAGANISWVHSNSESWQSTAKGIRTLYSAGTMNGGSPSNYSAGLHIAGNSNYAFQIAYNPASAYVLKYRGFDANSAAWNDWKQIAFITDNVASATKLQTPRTLWGQSFDGSANIGGDITFNALQDGRQLSIQQSGGIKFSTPPDNGWVTSLSIYANDKTTLLTSAFGVYGTGEYVRYAFIGGTYDNPNVVVKDDTGYVGIGNTSPTERLYVSGNILASGNINATSITINGVTITASNGSITVNGNVFATGDIVGGV